MANDTRDLRQSAIMTLGELQEILSHISPDEGRWAASLDWPIDPADVWWSGESVFISHSYDKCDERSGGSICFRFPAFLGGHSDPSTTLTCMHPLLADVVWAGPVSREETNWFDVFDAFNRFWNPIGMHLSIRNRRLHSVCI